MTGIKASAAAAAAGGGGGGVMGAEEGNASPGPSRGCTVTPAGATWREKYALW